MRASNKRAMPWQHTVAKRILYVLLPVSLAVALLLVLVTPFVSYSDEQRGVGDLLSVLSPVMVAVLAFGLTPYCFKAWRLSRRKGIPYSLAYKAYWIRHMYRPDANLAVMSPDHIRSFVEAQRARLRRAKA